MRKANIRRETSETQIEIDLNIDGSGNGQIDTGIKFLDHMLACFSKQGLFDLKIKATGDLNIDEHHTVEDVGIVLGQCFKKALGDKRGINRYGFFILPMDETLVLSAVDLGGRTWCAVESKFDREKIGDLSTELIYDFFQAFADNCGANIQIKVLYGRNTHHKIEAMFKAFGKAIRMACEIDKRIGNSIPSTKGIL